MAMLTIRDIDEDLLEKVKSATWCRTGSQAFIKSATLFLQQRDELKSKADEISRLRDVVAAQRQTIERARSAAAQLLEAAGQGDLLADSGSKLR